MKTSIENKASLNDEQLKKVFETMCLIRFFEEKVDYFFAKGMIHGTTHLAVGQEATAAGTGVVLKKSDWITATHRGHGQTIAKGTDVNIMMAELFGRTNGTNKGKGGSMHIAEMRVGNLGANGIVGGGYPIAVGAALSSQMRKSNQVTLCYAGDGSTNEGSFHESLNMASIWRLPVVFFVDNNKYAMSGNIEEMTNVKHLSERAKSYGFEGITINGNDIMEVIDVTYEAVEKARRGEGPTLIEALTYRWKGHSKSDAKKYRTKEEEEHWKTNMDPIKLAEERFIAAGVMTQEEADEMKVSAKARIEEAVVYAESGEHLTPEDLWTNVLAD